MMTKLEKHRHLWERDIKKYVLLQLIDNERPIIHNPYLHSMLLINEDIDTINEIINNMVEAGVERFTSFEDLYKKYPAPW
jgi:16S rRNA U1498 N3-methylase RsmE